MALSSIFGLKLPPYRAVLGMYYTNGWFFSINDPYYSTAYNINCGSALNFAVCIQGMPHTNILRRRFLRFALVHLPLWVVATLFVLTIYYDFTAPFLPQLLVTVLGTGMAAIPTYYSMYFLVPRLLYRRRIWAFIGMVIVIALINSIANYLLGTTWYHYMTKRPIFPSPSIILYVLLIIFSTNLAAITLGCALRIISGRFRMEEQLQEVEREKRSTELAFLRSQVNPHFLFNVLNTIYFQIDKGNPEARGSVEKLSELLRYQLYECTTDMIGIERELAYISSYVAVQQMRMEVGTDVSFDTEAGIGSFKIAPLLILPIIENAFKHISHHNIPAQNKLHIKLATEGDDYFVVRVFNTYDATHSTEHLLASGGLGLQNVRRRLELLYPGAYFLNVNQDDHTFEITLKIKYHD
ncbi:MAG: sensor histidine kinase [Chitinophagaceae bacterium]